MSCEALATKAEVAQLRQTVALLAGQLTAKADKSELANKLDQSEKNPIIEASITGALGQINPVIATLQALIAALQAGVNQLAPLIPIVATLLAVAPFLVDLYQKVNALVGQVADHTKRLNGHDLQIRQLELVNEIQSNNIKGLNTIVGAQGRQIAQAQSDIERVKLDLNLTNLEIERINSKVDGVNRIATAASIKATQAYTQANTARAEAIAASAKAQEAINLANNAIYQARLANLYATLASRRAQDALDRALMAVDRAFKAQRQAELATVQANLAYLAAIEAQQWANQIIAWATIAIANIEGQLRELKRQSTATIVGSPTSSIRTQLETLTNAQTAIQNRLTEQERVNAQGNTQLQNLSTQINNLPNTLIPAMAVAMPAIIIGSPSIRRMLTDTAAEGTCRTTQAGGCLSNQFNNLQNAIKNNLGSLANQANQVAQTALLVKIDAKLGAQITGGIGGKLTKFVNWAIIDRTINLVTMVASVHNVFQLSTSIQNSFFSAVDNVLNIGGLIRHPDGNSNINSRQWLTGSLDTFFSGLFGASEWTAVKAQWKAYSTIASTSAQAFNNLRQIHNDSQELLNMARNYTAQLGNALADEGIISEDNWDYKNPDEKFKSSQLNRLEKMSRGLEVIDNSLQAIEQVTATLLSITQTANEIKENAEAIQTAVNSANATARQDRDKAIERLQLSNFSLDDIF
jgi:hypothetical protein